MQHIESYMVWYRDTRIKLSLGGLSPAEYRTKTGVIQKYNIPGMYLFGSYARGVATEESDLDFLVDTTGTGLMSLLSLGELYCDLEEIFQKEIDLVTMRSVMQKTQTESDRSFRDTVMKERVSLSDVA